MVLLYGFKICAIIDRLIHYNDYDGTTIPIGTNLVATFSDKFHITICNLYKYTFCNTQIIFVLTLRKILIINVIMLNAMINNKMCHCLIKKKKTNSCGKEKNMFNDQVLDLTLCHTSYFPVTDFLNFQMFCSLRVICQNRK